MLCADDFAVTSGVSRGILRLAEKGRISATGAMTNSAHWPAHARDLRGLDGAIAIGLHLNLTLGAPLSDARRLARDGRLPRFNDVLRGALAGRLPMADVAQEIGLQIDAFTDALDRPPDFVDGHQHVHVLRGVRAALLSVLGTRGLAGRVWLRDPAERPAAIGARRVAGAKASVIATLAAGFGRAARAGGFATNAGFAGVSLFDPRRDFAADFARFLVAPGPRHLVMCHPGEIDDELRRIDLVVETRPQELAFLRSPRFFEICEEAGLTLATSWDVPM